MGEAIITRRGGGSGKDTIKVEYVRLVPADQNAQTETKTVTVDGTIFGVFLHAKWSNGSNNILWDELINMTWNGTGDYDALINAYTDGTEEPDDDIDGVYFSNSVFASDIARAYLKGDKSTVELIRYTWIETDEYDLEYTYYGGIEGYIFYQ